MKNKKRKDIIKIIKNSIFLNRYTERGRCVHKKRMTKILSFALAVSIGFGNILTVYANEVVDNEEMPQLSGVQENSAPTAQSDSHQAEEQPIMTPVEITQEIKIVKGESFLLQKPDGFSDEVVWSAKFLKSDGSFLRNSGYQKIKRELKEGEVDGTRTAGDADAGHLLEVVKTTEGATITAKNKGSVVVTAQDKDGKQQQWKVEILYKNPAELPSATEQDFKKIRETWKESIIGSNLLAENGGAEILESINKDAEKVWNSYAYKGQDKCPDIPWKEDEGKKGNKNTPYVDDAAEFRPAFQKVFTMAKAYAAEGGRLYQNPELLKDITNILDYLTTYCYTPKSQTDNWWTWEIGIPKDIIPALILLYEGLTPAQIMQYTEALYFFQPDPFYEGIINTASTHAQGYRKAQGANIIDCATTAVGLGALRQDNELVYLGMLASADTFTIHQIEDSSKIAEVGYVSGFYPDGSYLDHGRVPYLGAYGIEFMKGAVKIPALLAGTPWQYPEQVQKNLESYVIEGFGNGIYNGMMLDFLKGRSVSRPKNSNQDAGRESMSIVLQMVDSFSEPAKKTVLSYLKHWLQQDPEYINTLSGAKNIAVKQKAEDILEDSSIVAQVPPVHKSYPLMDRVIHRTEDYLFGVSMYSERIQNTEIMNHENRFGWHQNNGMTYIYDKDKQYTENYWNTVNPLRLAGTTVVPINIGNGALDSSGFAQGGDFCSPESWVGGSSIGNYGISGMALSGQMKTDSGDTSILYAPNLTGKKSWFMFDEEIVCLGAGISNQDMDLPVETTIENRKIGADGQNIFVVDGKEADLPVKLADIKQLVDGTADSTGTAFTNVDWAYLLGTKAIGTGYYFPDDNTTIHVRHAKTTGNWKDIGTFDGESIQDYLEMWVDHGINPTDSSYSYVLLPEKTQQQTQEYATNPDIEVVQNTKQAQAVYHKGLKILGINFWDNAGGKVANITVDKPASVMIQQEKDGILKVVVSDPTMKNMGAIQLVLNQPIHSYVHLDKNVSMQQQPDGSTLLTFQMAGTNGVSSMAELKIKEQVQVDKQKLEQTIQTAQNLKKEEYTQASWTILQQSLEKALEVFNHTDATQDQVDQVQQNLQKAIDSLVTTTDLTAANLVIKAIEQIGEVTLQSESKILEARKGYNALTPKQQSLVTNYDLLVKAEERLKELKNQGNTDNKVTLQNQQYKVTLTGIGLQDTMQLEVSPLSAEQLQAKKSAVQYPQNADIMLQVCLLQDGKEIPLPNKALLSIAVAAENNGKQASVVHDNMSTVEQRYITINNNAIELEVSSLGRFFVVLPKDASNPQTGTTVATGDKLPLIVGGIFVVSLVAATFFWKKKKTKLD